MATTFLLASCNDDDAAQMFNNPTGTGDLQVKFDNAYAGNDLILGAPNTVNSQGETLKVNQIKYIVSNIVLFDENGGTFTYPKSESYFIVNEANPASTFIDLTSIPAGNYTKIKFGIGVDQAQWEAGADGQGDFLAHADAQDMMWSWSAGYKFILFEGQFTSATVSSDTAYMVHTGKTGTAYNYTEVTLDLPTKAFVRTEITPSVHIVTDLSKIIDGTNKIALSDHNMGGMGAMIMGGEAVAQISANVPGLFTVDHVHND